MSMLLKNDWEKEKEVFEDWWTNRLDRPLMQIIDLTKSEGPQEFFNYPWYFLRHYPDVERALNELFVKLKYVRFLMEAYPNIWLNTGPGALALYLGAQIKYDDRVKTAWINGNFTLEEILEMDFDPDNEFWRYTVKAYNILSSRYKNMVVIGFPDFHEGIDALAQLRGNFPTNFLKDLFFRGNLVKKALEKIQDLFFLYFEKISQLINADEHGYSTWDWLWSRHSHHVSEWDLVAYLSPRHFRELISPFLEDECRYFERVIWHLDGPLELPHLDELLSIEELDGIQWIPGAGNPDPGDPRWLPLYTKIISNGKLLQLIDVPLEKIPNLLSHLPNHGRNVAILAFYTSHQQKPALNKLLSLFTKTFL